MLSAEYLNRTNKSNFFNLGTSKGYSIKEIFELCQMATGKKINFEIKPRREGDPAILVADYKKAKKYLNWEPEKYIENSVKQTFRYLLK